MDLNAIRTQAAKSDVRRAAKQGSLIVAGTSRGNISLERTEKGVRVATMGLESEVLSEGSQAAAVRALAPLYIIEIES